MGSCSQLFMQRISLYKYQLLYNSVDILQTDTKAIFNLSFCYLIQQEFSTYDSCKPDFWLD